MLIFYEGLPGSGKSYNACIDYIIPALQSGRHVFTNIYGLNHQKFADTLQLTIEEVGFLLHQLSDDECQPSSIATIIKSPKYSYQDGETTKSYIQDSLVIIDEAHKFYPASNKKIDEGAFTFFAEHRHLGLDVMLMSQSFKSVHKSVRERVQSKYLFVKMTAVGLANKYKWESYEATAPEQFDKISSGVKKYEDKYFGLYASHSANTTNKTHNTDSRNLIFNNNSFRIYLPLFLCALGYAVYYLYGFFHQKTPIKTDANTGVMQQTLPPAQQQAIPATTPIAPPVMPPPPKIDGDDFYQQSNGHVTRLVGTYMIDGKNHALVEVVDGTRTLGVYRSEHLEAYGYRLVLVPYGLRIKKENYLVVATRFKRTNQYAVSQDYNQQIALK